MAEPETQTESDSTFYNVMPEVTTSGKIVAPKVEPKVDIRPTQVNSAAAETVVGGPTATNITLTKAGGRSGLRRALIIVPVAILILGVAGAAAWFFFLRDKDSNSNTNANVTTNTQPENPDVTTPGDWLARFFGTDTCININQCGDKSDPDRDGFSNKDEYDNGTDPNNPDSDSDGISDGDEKLIFDTDPLISRTYRTGEYNDADFVKGGYDIKTDLAYTPERLAEIKTRVQEKGLHQPTLTTIGVVSLSLYDFKDPNTQALEDMNIDVSPQAKLDRDTRRQDTIKKVGSALLKFQKEKKSFPGTNDFNAMIDTVKPYITVATNYEDPINKNQYVYAYSAGNGNADFTLSYFSETQNQLIKYSMKNAQENQAKEDAAAQNTQRKVDLESIASALKIYSAAHVDSNSDKINVFPTMEQYPSVLVAEKLITKVPNDPNGSLYQYSVNNTYDSFTLKANYQNPPKGVTGYMCNEDECKEF